MSPKGDVSYCLNDATVAILLATYNGEKYIEEQLDSLDRQTYSDYVCYIHDDGSTDRTPEMVNAYCARHPEHFVYMGAPGPAAQNIISWICSAA